MSIADRIDAFNEEHEALENILEQVLYKIMDAHGYSHPTAWSLKAFAAHHNGDIWLEAYDYRDGETVSFLIPGSTIDENSVDDFCEDLKKEREAKEVAKKKKDKIKHLQAQLRRLEADE